MIKEEGFIVKATGGFYYVKTESRIVECRARGLFRKDMITPYVGDNVVIEHTENEKGYVVQIQKRENFLIRPPLANITRLILAVAVTEPPPNLLVLDKLIAIAEYRGINPAVVINKSDLADASAFVDIYKKAGFDTIKVSATTGENIDELKKLCSEGISAFCGNTGVGKSSLLNAIDPSFALKTADISKKLGRGKHTTRHVELFPFADTGYIADTPGFSAIEADKFEIILKEELEHCFREFEKFTPHCKFTGCSHTKEKGCAVLEAVESGEIGTTRHRSYLAMYEDAKGIKPWEKTKKEL